MSRLCSPARVVAVDWIAPSEAGGMSEAIISIRRVVKNFIRGGRGSIIGQSVGVRMLVLNLSNVLDRQVIDKTGLTGSYDFELKWTPDIVSSGPDAPPPPSDRDAPSLFTALSDQLGLKLESAKGPVQVWVIDGVERPSLN